MTFFMMQAVQAIIILFTTVARDGHKQKLYHVNRPKYRPSHTLTKDTKFLLNTPKLDGSSTIQHNFLKCLANGRESCIHEPKIL